MGSETPSSFKFLMKKRMAGMELTTRERHDLMKYLEMLSFDEDLSIGLQVAAKIVLASIKGNRTPKELLS